MSRFNDNLANIKITTLAIFIIASYFVLYILGEFTVINQKWIYVAILLFFAFALRDCFDDFRCEVSNVFSKVGLRHVLLIVFLNIFFSYGMLYLSDWLAGSFPAVDFLVGFYVPSMSLSTSLPVLGTFISTVVISPLSEELIFRGVLMNRLKLFTPTIFAVLISSLLFASLHSFGSILSAFVFAICMAILYLKTENICVPILAHFLNNLFAEIIRLADYNQLLFTDFWVMGIVGILAVISAVVLISFLVKELKMLNLSGL
jgi:membrane protease YdiL (CAAX protease family)